MFRMLTVVFYEIEKKIMVGSFRQACIEIVILTVLSGLISVEFTHRSFFRQSWGFPFEYKYKIDPAQAYSNLIQAQEGFKFFILVLDFIIVFCVLAAAYFLFKNFKSKLSLFD